MRAPQIGIVGDEGVARLELRVPFQSSLHARTHGSEVDRDVAREVVAPEDAERAKAEIARRLIAASKDQTAIAAGPGGRLGVVVTVVGVAAMAGGIYWSLGAPGYGDLPLQTRIALGDEARANRPSQEAFEAAAPVLEQPDAPEDYLTSVQQLRVLVPQRGEDLQGWELLAFHESQLRNYAAAADAQARVVEIRGEDASVEDLTRQADLLVAAADGLISHETEAVVRRLLDLDPNNIAGRYYLGALYDQTDRPDRALQLWRSILEAGAPETFHIAMARRQVEMTAARAGTRSLAAQAQTISMAATAWTRRPIRMRRAPFRSTSPRERRRGRRLRATRSAISNGSLVQTSGTRSQAHPGSTGSSASQATTPWTPARATTSFRAATARTAFRATRATTTSSAARAATF